MKLQFFLPLTLRAVNNLNWMYDKSTIKKIIQQKTINFNKITISWENCVLLPLVLIEISWLNFREKQKKELTFD